MQKALCIFGMVVAVLILLIFGLDMLMKWPFEGSQMWVMDLPFILCALALGYLGWSTLREQD
jgi:hypothetical protein